MTVSDKALAQAWRNRFISERMNAYPDDGYEICRAKAEADANDFEDAFIAASNKRTPPAQAAEAVERVARIERENEILHYERERWSAAYDSAVKVLVGIHAVIYPMVVKLDDGREMRFNSPYLHEQMQAISDRIRAIPDELAAIAAMQAGE